MITARYATIDAQNQVIQLYEQQPTGRNGFLEYVTITFQDNGTIKVKGDFRDWWCTLERTFVEDMNSLYLPHEKYIHYGYKNIIDVFKKRKKPYVKAGWYLLADTQQYEAIMSSFFTIL